MSHQVDYERRVRALWDAFARDGVEGMRPYIDDDVEWSPSEGDIVRGMDALIRYWEDASRTRSVVPHAWEQHGDCVLVHGSMRRFRDGGFVDTQPWWVYCFRGDKLQRAVACAGRDEALAVIASHRVSSTSVG